MKSLHSLLSRGKAIYNVLYIPSMKKNMSPPFVVSRHGNDVNDIPKIQVINPTEDDHYIRLVHTKRTPNGNSHFRDMDDWRN